MRRGMLLFSSALWRSGARIADSSTTRTGSRSTRSPARHHGERPEHRWEARTEGEDLHLGAEKTFPLMYTTHWYELKLAQE